MKTLRTAWLRIRSLWQRREVKQEIDEELRFHLEQRTAENIAAGMAPEEAAREARKRFGNVQSIREECRDAKGASFGETTLQDVRFGLRMLAKNWRTTVTILLTLAICIGANSAVFTMVYSILLKPYPYPEAGRVVNVGMMWRKMTGDAVQEISPPAFLDIKNSATSFESLGFIEADKKADLRLGDRSVRFNIAKVTPGVWTVTRVKPVLGRCFTEQDIVSGDESLVVLSYGVWREYFNGNQDVIGRKILLDNRPCEVIGVMPEGFSVACNQAQLWTPKIFSVFETSEGARTIFAFQAIGRLKDGVSLAQARQELKVLHAGFVEMHPESRAMVEPTGESYGVTPITAWVSYRAAGSMLLSIQAAAALVLLIGCLNIAGVMVVQGHGRLREIAVRHALGATRWRLARQIITEGVMVFLIGGALGSYAAWAGMKCLPGHFGLSQMTPFGQPARFGGSMFVFTLCVSLVVGLISVSIPVLFATKHSLGGVLQATGQRATGGKRRHWTQSLFVVAQVAFALVLLTMAGVTVRNICGLLGKGFGVEIENRIVAKVALPEYRYGSDAKATREKINPFKEQAIEKLRALPGVKSAAVSSRIPLSADHPMKYPVQIPGRQAEPGEPPMPAFVYQVQPAYFRTLGMAIRRGRDFDASDNSDAEPVAVISEKIVRKYFSDREAIGAYVEFFGRQCRIIGVVGETQSVPVSYLNAPTIYFSSSQWPVLDDEAVFVIHTDLPARVMTQAVTKALTSVDPLLTVQITSMGAVQRSAILTQSVPMEIAGFFAAVAILLAAIGLYGVLAHSVSQRTKEFGIRLALGTPNRSIFRMVLCWGGRLAIMGVALGTLLAVPVLRWIKPLMVETDAARPDVLIYAAWLVFAVILLASYLPARRAAKTNPMEALRCE